MAADQSLVEQLRAARAGSPEALGEALEACRLYLLAIADRELDSALQPKGGASDLVQETFLEAQRDFSQFRGSNDADLRAWLRMMLRNNLSNFARHYRATDKRRIDLELSYGADSSSVPTREAAANTPTPSRIAVADEEMIALRAAIARLPDDYRQILTLRYIEDRPFEEVAQLMNRSNNAVRKLWGRALDQLHKEMGGAS